MMQQSWTSECRKILICVDSYEEGVLRGRFYNPYCEAESFSSLSQFLIRIQQLLDELQLPQSDTELRTFSPLFSPGGCSNVPSPVRRGGRATFELQVIFRQHTSWQGLLIWREGDAKQRFRSVLELVLLLDSALRGAEIFAG